MDAPPFTHLADGRFQITRVVGEGGMGVVYEALDREQRTPIALKMMRSSSGDAVLRLKTEFRSLRDVRHPGLVRLGELFVERAGCFFTMELIEGVDLLEHVWNHAAWPRRTRSRTTVTSKLPAEQAHAPERTVWDADTLRLEVLFDEAKLRAALRQVAEALAALHVAGKVHRDVKPTNVLVTPQGRAVLLDFGLVADHGDAIAAGLIEGTIEYMAPEQAAGAPADAAADLYAVGAVLYEALTGRPPFTGDPLDVITDKRTRDPVAPGTLFAGTPPDLDELCVQLVARDPARRPSASVLAAALAEGGASSTRPFARVETPAPEIVFVGRTAELAALHQAFEDARERPIAMLVSGESGLGKSALMREFAQRLRDQPGALVFSGRCHAHESIPFRAFDGVADALSRYLLALPPAERAELLPEDTRGLARLFRVFERLSPPDHASSTGMDVRVRRRRAFAALHELLCNLAERGPLALVIDDLQWFDSDSQLLFEGILANQPPPLLLAGMIRPVRRPVEALRAGILALGVELREITLPRLSDAECRDLARTLMPAGGESIASIAAACHGSPLFVEQMVASVHSGKQLGGTLEEVVWDRLGGLEPNVRAVLDLVCTADVAIDRASIARAAGIQRTQLAAAVTQLEELRLVRTTGARRQDLIEPYHDQVRQATRARLTPEQLQRRHRLLAEVLEKRSAPHWLVFHHWLAANDPERAVPHAIEAAVGSQHELAARRVAKLCETALELLPLNHPARRHLCRALAVALANAGKGVDAAAWYLEAAAQSEGTEALELKRLAGDHLLRSGRLDEGLPVLREVLEAVGVKLPETPRQALTSLVWRRAKLRLRALRPRAITHDDRTRVRADVCLSTGTSLAIVDPIAGASLQAQALIDALALGDPERIALARALEVGYAGIAGTRGAANTARVLAEAERAADRAGTAHARAMVAWMRGVVSYLDGRFRDARTELDRAARSYAEHCPGHVWEQAQAELFAAWAASHLGDLRDLTNRVAELERVARWHDDRYTQTLVCSGNSVLPPLAADRSSAARERIDGALRGWPDRGFHIQHVIAFSGHLEIDLYEDDRGAAWRRVEATWPALEKSLQLRIQHVKIFMLDYRARAALAAGGRELVDEAEACARKVMKEGAGWGDALATARLAAVAAARGDRVAAEKLLRDADAALTTAGLALHAACARLRLASLAGAIDRTAAWSDLAAQGIARPDRWMAMFTPWPSLRAPAPL